MKNYKDISYKITFFSEWHCGSGLTSGSDLDGLVVRDGDGFPFIPGKTLKGLLKEAAECILSLQNKESGSDGFITKVFGYFDEGNINASKIHSKGEAFFSDAVIHPDLKQYVCYNSLEDYFFRKVASTKIGENGIAEKHSLRSLETTIPCELTATIYHVDEEYKAQLQQCMQWVKRLGLNRHRGLGRCKFEIIEQ